MGERFCLKDRMMRYKKITSTSNPLIREILEGRKKRTGDALIVEGLRLLETALASETRIGKVFFTDTFRSKNEAFLMQMAERSPELIETSDHVLSQLADTETPQGIVAEVFHRSPRLAELSLQRVPLIVVCDGIQDPGNLGTIIRTADAAGADAVVLLSGTCDPFMPKAIRATAGSIFNLPVVSDRPEAVVEWLGKKSIGLIVSDVRAQTSIFDADMRVPLALVFGNEAAGVTEYLKSRGTIRVKIPIPGKAESLNVATSAAICLYEAVRQRNAAG